MKQQIVVYTDLDGTLLDLETYNPETAKDKLHQLIENDKTVVFCSSKTFAEQVELQHKLGISQPMITENGSGVFIPKNYDSYFDNLELEEHDGHYVYSLGKDHDTILKWINQVRESLKIDVFGYSDLTKTEIAKITNIPYSDLKPTITRNFSETLIKGDFKSAKFSEFTSRLQSIGLQCTKGSKFYTISSNKSDKGKAVNWLQKQFESVFRHYPLCIGIGDSQNDVSMLEQADHAYLVQKPDKTWADITNASIIKIPEIGPKGWNIIAERLIRKNED